MERARWLNLAACVLTPSDGGGSFALRARHSLVRRDGGADGKDG